MNPVEMNPVELNAYGIIFRNGTVRQIRKTLYDIVAVEPVVTEDLMAAILNMLRNRGKEVVREFAWPIHKLLGKTKSMALYGVADEQGYLDIARFQCRFYANGKVQLFINQRFFHPGVEPLVLDELFQWLSCIEQDIGRGYADERRMVAFGHSDCDVHLKKSEFIKEPLIPVWRMLNALAQMASSKGRESLLALEYIFRPHTNDYLMIERQRVVAGDVRAVPRPTQPQEEEYGERLVAGYATPTVYHLQKILDAIAHIGRSSPPSVPVDQTIMP